MHGNKNKLIFNRIADLVLSGQNNFAESEFKFWHIEIHLLIYIKKKYNANVQKLSFVAHTCLRYVAYTNIHT